jgi:cytochrome c553
MAPGYLAKALRDYASGKRSSTEMEPYAKMAVQLGVDEVAGYFASQKREPTSAGLDGGSVARGKAAAAQCAVCHGADGRGMPPGTFPTCAPNPRGTW